MKKYNLAIPFVSFLFFGFVSCADDEAKTQNQDQVVSRPDVPTQNGQVRIGTQVWMTRNLNVSKYRNGDLIPQVTDPTQWQNLTTGAWCYYDNNAANGAVYGKLYNWFAVNDPRGLAPAGWHVPSIAEYTLLTNFLGGEDIAGNKMKATTGWIPYSGVTSSNSSGFTGLPGGYRNGDATFAAVGYAGYWWCSTENKTTFAWGHALYYINGYLDTYNYNKTDGFSMRCIKG